MQTAISDYNHLAHVRVLRQIQKFICYCTVLPCFILTLRVISNYKPPRAYIRTVDLAEGFLRYDFRGLIHGGAYFRNFYGTLQFAILDNNCIFFVFIDNYRLLYFSTKMWFMK